MLAQEVKMRTSIPSFEISSHHGNALAAAAAGTGKYSEVTMLITGTNSLI